MKKVISFLTCMVLLFGIAAAEQTVALPDSRYVIDVPNEMKYSAPDQADNGVQAYKSDTLEMDYLSYSLEEATALGISGNMQETAELLAAGGAEAEVYEVNGIEMLVYRLMDDADGAPGIGYVFADGNSIIEIIFWYATQDAAETTKMIMETIRFSEQ